MKKINNRPIDKRRFVCPQCGKHRIFAPIDHVISNEKRSFKTATNEEVELYIEVCDPCAQRNYATYFKPSKASIRRILEQHPMPEDKSLEDIL